MPSGIAIEKKFNYFYKIINLINNKFYYGIRSCDCDPSEDPYMGSGFRLRKAYEKYGVENFEKLILKILPTREDALDLERWIVDINLVEDTMCYNMVLGGGSLRSDKNPRADLVNVIDTNTNERLVVTRDQYKNNPNLVSVSLGKVVVYDVTESRYKSIDKSEYDNGKDSRYLVMNLVQDGKVKLYNKLTKSSLIVQASDSRVFDSSYRRMLINPRDYKYTVVNNGIEVKRVLIEELDEYLSNGWNRGMIKSYLEGYIHINKDGITKAVNPLKLDSYLNNGWKIGIGYTPYNKGTKEMHKGSEFKYVPLDEVQSYLDDGYEFGGLNHNSNKGFVFVIKDNDLKMIHPEELDSYLLMGYRRGQRSRPNCKGLKRINNGVNNKLVRSCELDTYLSSGWSLGWMNIKGKVNGRKSVTLGDGTFKFVNPDEVQSYLDKGYKLGQGSKPRKNKLK